MRKAWFLLLLLMSFAVLHAEDEYVVQEGKLRVTVLTPKMLRIQFGEEGTHEVSPSRLAPRSILTRERDGKRVTEKVAFNVHYEDKFLYIETEHLTLRYELDGEILPNETNDQVLRVSFRLNNRTVIWYPGKDDALNLKALPPDTDLSEMTDADRSKLPNGLLSRAGWSVIDMEGQRQSQHIDWLFLGYGHDYEGALRDFCAITASPSRPSQVGEKKGGRASWEGALSFAPYLAATASNGATVYYGRSWDEEVLPNETNEECYVRWMQLAAFMPARETATPDSALIARLQQFDQADALIEALELQRDMRPYADSIQALGYTLCRPLYYDFPEENNAYVYEDEFLFGSDILVAPITRPVQKDGLARRGIWVPPGRWWDTVEERWIEGSQVLKGEYTLRDIPVFWSQGYVKKYSPTLRLE